MGMSSRVYGIKPADEKYKKMLEIYNLCKESKVNIPDEVVDFFDNEPPESKGVIIELKQFGCLTSYNEEMVDGYEIELGKIPKDIKIIRFVNCY